MEHVRDFPLRKPTADLLLENEAGAMYHGSMDFTIVEFEGRKKAFNKRLQKLLKDVWKNSGGELDAWQQLYLLACIKTYFKDFWRRGRPDRSYKQRKKMRQEEYSTSESRKEEVWSCQTLECSIHNHSLI